eukprot:gnl/MRDRNA2_/MRDRNA2_177906_c0_seq1.p1 gnl/MRDRNA2_/MRDRNA2_177906_c0~~gnl/MRDRNA2_/MRDRNA2_177906_c0_seq1.p1  ORF type:complete len:105 (+),score=1.07 gnl/MRDRNA2_/MRDRNA2_177906_c0_seq1:103-417(+)
MWNSFWGVVQAVGVFHCILNSCLVCLYLPLRMMYSKSAEFEAQAGVGFLILLYGRVMRKTSGPALLRTAFLLAKATVAVIAWQTDSLYFFWYAWLCMVLWIIVP